jgi:hypothetical protein
MDINRFLEKLAVSANVSNTSGFKELLKLDPSDFYLPVNDSDIYFYITHSQADNTFSSEELSKKLMAYYKPRPPKPNLNKKTRALQAL